MRHDTHPGTGYRRNAVSLIGYYAADKVA